MQWLPSKTNVHVHVNHKENERYHTLKKSFFDALTRSQEASLLHLLDLALVNALMCCFELNMISR